MPLTDAYQRIFHGQGGALWDNFSGLILLAMAARFLAVWLYCANCWQLADGL